MSEGFDPKWTDLHYPPGGARDALRLETVGEAILEELLPGINTVTHRARYYSFWAWVLHEFIKEHEVSEEDLPGHTQQDFYEWLRPREDMLILAHLAHGHRTGAVGTDQGYQVWQAGQRDEFPLDWKSLSSVNGGAYQANYSGALEQMNIISRESGLPHDALQNTSGLRLAEEYGRSVSNTEYVRLYRLADKVPRSVVDDFAEFGCLCGTSRFPDERQALVDAFFRFDTVDARAGRRLASLSFLLDVVDQARGMPLDLHSMRAVLYFWSYAENNTYVPEGNLVKIAKRWRVFQLRQYYVFGIECLWALFLSRVRGLRVRPDEYLSWLFDNLDLAALGERYGISWPTHDLRALTLQEFHDAVEGAVGEGRFVSGTAALDDDLNEHHLYLLLHRRAPDQDATLWAGTGLLMLCLLRRRCRDWRGDAGWDSDSGGEDRLSIEAYLSMVGQTFEEGWTVDRWLSWFHERCLWLRHRRVALEKMMDRGRDPALFEWEEGRFWGLAEDRPKMNNPRLENALSILRDLDLVRRESGAGQVTYALTPDGRSLLERFRSHDVMGGKG